MLLKMHIPMLTNHMKNADVLMKRSPSLRHEVLNRVTKCRGGDLEVGQETWFKLLAQCRHN